MDDEADTPSGCNSHSGLIDYANYSGLGGRKYEDSWNNRLAELLDNDEVATSREFRYPNNSRKKCDIIIQKGDVRIWVETKGAWKCWFSSKTGKQEENSANYKGYFYGDGKTHSVAQDIEKLNRLNSKNADYVGLLIIGFDISDDPIDPDMGQLIEKMELKEEGWEIFGPEIWTDRNHPDCRYNCWFFGKKVQ
ncbi:MAG: hypothetical protein DRP56_05215 [Planctomycetota bacterium]|nr:MAG: hypothetical protein DRP56_05215 [Planctomycetota bacterium]